MIKFSARALSFVAALVATQPTMAAGAADRLLFEAVNAGSLGGLHEALASGADPNVTFGRFYEEKPLCIATERGKEALLRAMIDAGTRVDFIYEEGDAVSISPLQCAAVNDNLEAFEMLHRAGARIERDFCPSCDTGLSATVLIASFAPARYHIGRYVIENADIDPRDQYMIKRNIEDSRIRKDDPTLPDRAWIVEWLRERGHEVSPAVPE